MRSSLVLFLVVLVLKREAIARAIVAFLSHLGLSIEFCRGQGYDGAGNMAGRLSGASTRIKALQNKAVFVHWNSHILNLCIAACCLQQVVRNMMDQVRVTSEFFNFSPKRSRFLQTIIKEDIPDAKHKILINVCRTRWVKRIDLFVAIVRCLEVIKNNVDKTWNPESTVKASGLYHCITSFQFIVSLVVVSKCLEVTRPLTVQLQSASIDTAFVLILLLQCCPLNLTKCD